jgi:hypothetical protein
VVLAFERWETAYCVIAMQKRYSVKIASFLAMTQCAVIALGKAKTAGALAERWLGWAQKGQR